MKILTIRIKNLASLESPELIDFTKEPLLSAGIFAITGPTGSGKSTILDALCLALYGRTPRYAQAREQGVDILDADGTPINQGDIRGILRDGAGDGFAEVDFTGADGLQYRAGWYVRRARYKANGSLQQDTMSLWKLPEETPVPGKKQEVLKEIQQRIGLSFEQFTRSVLLAQGDFTAFLKAGKDEKASLLEKLTGTRIYSDISKRIFEKNKEAAVILKELYNKVTAIAILPEEEKTVLETKQATLANEIKELEQRQDWLKAVIEWQKTKNHLSEKLTEATKNWQKAVAKKESTEEKRPQLNRLEAVQQVRTWADAKYRSQQQQQELQEVLTSLQANYEILLQQKATKTINQQQATQQVQEQKKKLNDLQPYLQEARKLDTLLQEKKAYAILVLKEWDAAKAEQQQQQQQIASRQQEADKILIEIKRLESWLAGHAARKKIAEDISSISARLGDAEKQWQLIQDTTAAVNKGLEEISALDKTEKTLEVQEKLKMNEAAAHTRSLERRQQEIDAIPVTIQEEEREKLIEAIAENTLALAAWQLLYHDLTQLVNASQELERLQQELAGKTAEREQVNIRLKEAEIKKSTLATSFEKAKILSGGQVTALQAMLTEGEPCPVCGSTSHPQTPAPDHTPAILISLEMSFREAEQAYNNLLTEYNNLDKWCEGLSGRIEQTQQDLPERESRVQRLRKNWEKSPAATVGKDIADDKKEAWLTTFRQNQQEQADQIGEKLNHYKTIWEQQEAEKKKEAQRLQELATITEQRKDTIRHKKSREEYIQQQQQLLTRQETDFYRLLTELDAVFPNPDWRENWKKNPQLFLKQIAAFAEEWKEKTAAYNRDTQKQATLIAALREMEEQTKTLVTATNRKETVCMAAIEEEGKLARQRAQVLDGKDVVATEKAVQEAMVTAEKIQQQTTEALEAIRTSIARTETEKEQLLKQIHAAGQAINKGGDQIRKWLDSYNEQYQDKLDEETITALLATPLQTIESLRTLLRIVAENETAALLAYKAQQALWEQHEAAKATDIPAIEIEAQLEKIKVTITTAISTRNRAGFELEQDQQNRKKEALLQKEIIKMQEDSKLLGQLNDLIGSADGKIFRQVAQGYTLDLLLAYANKHLETFTGRYRLERIPGTLGLQVLDMDMGNELRTVFSLSGGESFLVSLALALGLASLSSAEMNVGSLFIDEGFGSLDPATLNMAMDALERLHNQGRKVGVISHVQEMTERIPVQVRVIRLSRGKSRLEITDEIAISAE